MKNKYLRYFWILLLTSLLGYLVLPNKGKLEVEPLKTEVAFAILNTEKEYIQTKNTQPPNFEVILQKIANYKYTKDLSISSLVNLYVLADTNTLLAITPDTNIICAFYLNPNRKYPKNLDVNCYQDGKQSINIKEHPLPFSK